MWPSHMGVVYSLVEHFIWLGVCGWVSEGEKKRSFHICYPLGGTHLMPPGTHTHTHPSQPLLRRFSTSITITSS